MSWGDPYKFPINPEPDTIFFAIKSEDRSSSYSYFSRKNETNKDEPNSQKLFLMSEFCEFPIFEYIPKEFSISTKNITCNFNSILLKETSSVISDILKNNSSEKSYFINVIDEENVLRKFEELYQGKTVVFDEDEIPSSQQITKILKIKNCPNLLKPKSLKYNQDVYDNGRTIYNYTFSHGGTFNDNKITVKICLKWFIEYLRKNEDLQIFTISTKNNKYKCNIFGIYSSNIIRQILDKDQSITSFNYDFDDESNDFQLICDLFNFKQVGITNKNMNLLKKIADDLQIDCIIKQIDDFISSYEKIIEKVEREKIIIDSIDNLFDLFYNIKKYGIQKVKDSIIGSKWIQNVDSIKEMAAFIIQIVRSTLALQQEMADLLIQLNEEANESNKLNELIPFIVNTLMCFYFKDKKNTFFRSVSLHSLNDIENLENKCAYQFIFILYKKGIIPKEKIIEKLKNYDHQNRYINVYFLIELMELNPKIVNEITTEFRNKRYTFSSVIEKYFPDKIDQYQKMIEKMEPDDELTKSLRNDDVDKLQYIIETDEIDVSDAYVPYNIFDDFYEKVTLINYAAYCGSLQCFKYLLSNNGKVDDSTFYFAAYGNNFEIIKIVDSTKKSDENKKKKIFKKGFGKFNNEDKEDNPIQTLYINGKSVYCLNHCNDDTIISSAIILHRNELFDWLFEKKFISKNRLGNDLKEIAMISAINGNAHSLIEIIDKGFNINTDIILSTAKNGFYQLTKLLLSMIDQKEKSNAYQSVLFGNLSIFELFFNEMNETDRIKSINHAIERNYKDIIDYFFDNIEKVNHSITHSFILSSLNESIQTNKLFDFLFEKYKKIKPTAFKINSLNKLLYNACTYSNLHAVKIITDLILAKNSHHDFNDDFLASNSAEICRYFIDKKVNINYEQLSFYPSKLISFDSDLFLLIFKEVSQATKNKLMRNTNCAIKNKNKKLIEFFLNENKPKRSELIEAVYTHDIEIVDLILKYNKDPSFINHCGGEALIAASRNNDLDIVKRLLSLPGIDPTLFEPSGETVLSTAILNNNLQIVEEIVNFFGNDDNIQKNISFFYYSFQLISKNINGNNNNNNYNFQNNNNINNNVNCNYLKSIVKVFEMTSIDPNYCGKNTFLFEACMYNEIEVVEQFLKLKNIDVNKYDINDFYTPLMIAIENKNIKIAKLLIQYPKTNLNLRNLYDESALTIAVSKNLKTIVDLILNNSKFDPVESNFNFAFFNANSEIAKQLTKYSFIDVNYTFGITYKDIVIDKTALVHSVYINDVEKIDFIINHPSFDKDKSNIKEAIFESAKTNNINIFRKLIKFVNNDVNISNQKGKTLLLVASKKLSGEIINEIFNNPNFDPKKSQICEAFIQSFASIFGHNYYLMNAPWIKRKKYDNCLTSEDEDYQPNWEKKQKIDDQQIWQSKECIMNYESLPPANTKIEIMNKLLNYDKENSHLIHLNELLPDGRSFFTSICSNYDDIDEVCKFLLNHGADPNQKDKKGIFPLLTAIGLESVKFVSTLLNNADIDFSQLGNKTTYLHVAAAYSDSKIVKLLLEKNVSDINSKDINGDTPLIIACKAKKADVVEYLFKQENLDYLHRNNNGIDALNTIKNISPSDCDNARKNKNAYENLIMNKISGKHTFVSYVSKETLNTNNVFTFKNQNDN